MFTILSKWQNCTILNLKYINQQIIENLPKNAIETIEFLKNVWTFGFLKKKIGFKIVYKAYRMILFPKKALFPFELSFFRKKLEKSQIWKKWKFCLGKSIYWKKTLSFFWKELFSRGTVALQYFRQRDTSDWPSIQQKIFRKKPTFDTKEMSMETIVQKIKAVPLEN